MGNKKEIIAGTAAVAALAASAHSAEAGSANNWSGFYAGLSAGVNGGGLPMVYSYNNYGPYSINGATVGAFVGFNKELSNHIVLGAEVALSSGGAATANDLDKSTEYGLNHTLDFKGKLGYDLGKAMVYGVVGASNQDIYGWDKTYQAWGVNYGVGVDAKVSDHIVIGAELLGRSMTGVDGYTGAAYNRTNATGSLRLSYFFN